MLPDNFRTARLLLRPITAADAGPIFDAYAQDPEVTRFLTWRPHRNRTDTDAYIARCIATPPRLGRTYAMTAIPDGTLIGALDLRLAGEHRLECGYVLARPHWRRGLMTEALIEVAARVLDQPSVFRVGAVCDTANLASARVLRKAGFTQEGVLRRWMVHPNLGPEPRDCLSYASVR